MGCGEVDYLDCGDDDALDALDALDGVDECYLCGAQCVDEFGYCLACDGCVDCGEPPRDCQCWRSRYAAAAWR